MGVSVHHNRQKSRFDLLVEGEPAGLAQYVVKANRYIFTHTAVQKEFGGRGLGGVLARSAMDEVRQIDGAVVLPLCPFIVDWLDKHPDYDDLVDHAALAYLES